MLIVINVTASLSFVDVVVVVVVKTTKIYLKDNINKFCRQNTIWHKYGANIKEAI